MFNGSSTEHLRTISLEKDEKDYNSGSDPGAFLSGDMVPALTGKLDRNPENRQGKQVHGR